VAGGSLKKILDDGLYSVAATDLHAPTGARQWIERALGELRAAAGKASVERLFRDAPAKVLAGETVEMPDAGGVDGGTP